MQPMACCVESVLKDSSLLQSVTVFVYPEGAVPQPVPKCTHDTHRDTKH